MNGHQIRKLYPNASESFVRANCADDPRENAKLEPSAKHEPLEAPQAQEDDSRRILVSVTSVRKRLCDEDNIAEKFTVDCLRYCGAIPTDAPENVKIVTSQRKAQRWEIEHTRIEINYNPIRHANE